MFAAVSPYRPTPLNVSMPNTFKKIEVKPLMRPLFNVAITKDSPSMSEIRAYYNYKPNWTAHNVNISPEGAIRDAQLSTVLNENERKLYDENPTVKVPAPLEQGQQREPPGGEGFTEGDTREIEARTIMGNIREAIERFEEELRGKVKMPDIMKDEARREFYRKLPNMFPILTKLDISPIDSEGKPITSMMAKLRMALPAGSRTLPMSENKEIDGREEKVLPTNIEETHRVRAELERKQRMDEVRRMIIERNLRGTSDQTRRNFEELIRRARQRETLRGIQTSTGRIPAQGNH
jgi:hypothetical protein